MGKDTEVPIRELDLTDMAAALTPPAAQSMESQLNPLTTGLRHMLWGHARSRVHSAQEKHDVRGLGQAETLMRTSLSQLFARCEAYPDLKANENFLALQERISQLEDAIADRREIFNESVRLNNTRIQQVPDVVLARSFGFGELAYLKFETVALLPVKINLKTSVSR